MVLREMGYEGVKGIQIPHNRTFVSVVMNLWIPYKNETS
jgi:hypothetical protein